MREGVFLKKTPSPALPKKLLRWGFVASRERQPSNQKIIKGAHNAFRLYATLLLLVIVGGCRGDSQWRLTAEQQVAIVREAETIFTHENVAKLEYTKRLKPDADVSPTLAALGAERVWLKPTGLYIRMGNGFVSERGYYIPAPSVDQRSLSPHSDPSYIKVADHLYLYEYR